MHEPQLSATVAPTMPNSSKRFKHFVNNEQLSELSKGYTPKNTDQMLCMDTDLIGLDSCMLKRGIAVMHEAISGQPPTSFCSATQFLALRHYRQLLYM